MCDSNNKIINLPLSDVIIEKFFVSKGNITMRYFKILQSFETDNSNEKALYCVFFHGNVNDSALFNNN